MTDDAPVIPGYTIEHLLGEGGMARVYLAIQRGFERPVALKIIAQELAANEEFGKRFLREARIVGGLSHQHIVPVYDVGEHDGVFYLAMEILAEGDLRSRMGQPLDEAEALHITRQLASALGYAHKKGFIHRDVKPDNVLFRDADTAVLTDFGIARTAEDSEDVTQITQVQSVIGSPKYMSPEQALGHQLDARTDIYSLGIMLFQMLTGEVPYAGRNLTEISLQRFEQKLPRLPEHLGHLQPLMDGLVAYDRDQRFANCEEVLAALASLPEAGSERTVVADANATAILEAPSNSQRPSAPTSPPGKSGITRTNAALAAGIAIVLAGAGVWYAQRGDDSGSAAGRDEVTTTQQPDASAIAAPPADRGTSGGAGHDGQEAEAPAKAQDIADTPIAAIAENTPEATPDASSAPVTPAGSAPVPEPQPEPATLTAVPTPSPNEFFAFYDAVNEGGASAESAFLRAYPDSIFADILRAKLADGDADIQRLTQQAKAGSARAQLVLSELYDTGWGVPQDKQAALEFSRRAAAKGSPFALYHHATLLLARAQTDAQRRAGLRVLEESARQRFFLAETVLANYLFEGRLLGRDVDESLRLLESAGDQGDRNALFNLGRIYDAGLNLSRPDTARARTYFLEAARLGHPQAQSYLQEPL